MSRDGASDRLDGASKVSQICCLCSLSVLETAEIIGENLVDCKCEDADILFFVTYISK